VLGAAGLRGPGDAVGRVPDADGVRERCAASVWAGCGITGFERAGLAGARCTARRLAGHRAGDGREGLGLAAGTV
ncbi:MAG: hypothetical protein MK335_13355, partial [Gemmatimonadetes bacterium]|nr:hypothetical protein [Gemmatimonadota bacterium]